jgi:hypothetical protein
MKIGAPAATTAHSPFGGSSAARVLNCPASISRIEKMPEQLRNKSSAYAERGTALHAALAELIADDADERALPQFVGKKFDNYVLTDDDVENALRPAFQYALTLLDTPGAEFYIERRVAFPGIADTFGTADLIVRIDNTVRVVDWKFGGGVRVLALYPVGDDDVVNSQLLFYGAAARHSLPECFAGVDNITLTICQPAVADAEIISTVTVSHDELDSFIEAYRGACAEALSNDPRLARGAWCRFCPARPICPLHTAALLDFAQFEIPASSQTDYQQVLAVGLNLAEAVKEIHIALHDQAKRALEHGDDVPGYALTAGRGIRNWKDEPHATAELQQLGLELDDIVVQPMRSPRQVETRAKSRGRVPPELISSTRSGVSLVRAENAHAPLPGRDELVRSFSAALNGLQGGGQS